MTGHGSPTERGRDSAPGTVLEVHLEGLGQHSWLAALANTLVSIGGSAQFRFVARARGAPDEPSLHVAVGGTFPVMRFSDLDDEHEPNAWLELAREAFAELDADLLARGWRRRPERGRHWWSTAYERPEPVDGLDGRADGASTGG